MSGLRAFEGVRSAMTGRLNVHDDVADGKLRIQQPILHSVTDIMTFPYGKLAIHFHMNIHKITQTALTDPALLNSNNPVNA